MAISFMSCGRAQSEERRLHPKDVILTDNRFCGYVRAVSAGGIRTPAGYNPALMFPIPVQRDFSLRHLNTFGIDARAAAYLPVDDVDTLLAVKNDKELSVLPRLILGGGSNLLLTQDFAGLVLHMRGASMRIVNEDEDFVYVTAAAGENWHRFVQWSLDLGLGGLENLSLIPGSVGAAPIQNIGAYGIEVKDRFHSLTAFDFIDGKTFTLDSAACRFAYRDSIFKQELRDRAVVLDVTFALPKRWQANMNYADVMQELNHRAVAARHRRCRDRNPPPQTARPGGDRQCRQLLQESGGPGRALRAPAGTMAEPGSPRPARRQRKTGGRLADRPVRLEGKSLGRAGVYPKQALVLVNNGGASGEEVLALARAIQADVQARFGVLLEPEPVMI
jgi:UDP-N-acetylmuramate dehydrogenase